MTDLDLAQNIVMLLLGGGGLGAIGYLLRIRVEKRKLLADAGKTEADAVQVISGAAITLLAPLKGQVEHLQGQVAVLERQVEELTTKLRETSDALHQARTVLARNGLSPYPRGDDG